jgi:hypothetical protein
MATNKIGVIQESIWRDKDFRALSRDAQCTYLELISQSVIDRAGVQPLQVTKWAKGCNSITVEDIWRDLKELQAARFVFFDDDTEEVFVRSYMRTCEVWKVPNTLKSALRAATVVASEMLRHEVAVELRKLRRADATATANEIDPGDRFAYPSATHSEPIANPSVTHPEGFNPSGTHREPTGTGTGMGIALVPEIESFRAEQPNTVPTKPDETEPPTPNCPRHPNGTTDNCGACGEARRSRQKWDTEQRRAQGAARSEEARRSAELRAAAVAECDLCDNDGYRGAILCDHDPDGDARTSRGIAAVKAALAGKDA